MMNYCERLAEQTRKCGHILCLGLDPERERIPLAGNPREAMTSFLSAIIDGMVGEKIIPAAVKPNRAFFDQYGHEGYGALRDIIEKARSLEIPIILDAKYGDIGKTSHAYARTAFDVLGSDAVTVSPYMGKDSIDPFLAYAGNAGKGVYVLLKTSNPGSRDIQELSIDGTPLYLVLSKLLCDWYIPGLGAVLGATQRDAMGPILSILAKHHVSFPLLIPGVGTQGGSATEVLTTLFRQAPHLIPYARVNVSSAILYAHESSRDGNFVAAAIDAARMYVHELKI